MANQQPRDPASGRFREVRRGTPQQVRRVPPSTVRAATQTPAPTSSRRARKIP